MVGRSGIVLLAVLGTAAWLATGAYATTSGAGYPGPTPSSTSAAPTSQTPAAGAVVAGQSITAQACGFQPSQSVTTSLDGQATGTDIADTAGCVTLDISTMVVNGQVEATVNGRGPYDVHYGQNDAVVIGTGANGAGRTVTVDFVIDPKGLQATPPPSASSAPASSQTTFGGLAFTGADIAAGAGASLLLLGVGAMLVGVSRRRQGRSAGSPGRRAS